MAWRRFAVLGPTEGLANETFCPLEAYLNKDVRGNNLFSPLNPSDVA